jgi:hypothetical protein
MITGLFILTPSILFIQTGVGNTALFAPLNALIFAELSWMWKRGATRRSLLRATIMLAMGVYTRLEALFWLLPAGLIFLREIHRGRHFRLFAPYMTALMLILLPLFLRNGLLYGDPFARAGLFPRGQTVSLFEWLRTEPPLFLRAMFINLGQGFIFAPDWIYASIAVLFVAGWFGALIRTLRKDMPSCLWPMLLHMAALLTSSIALDLHYIVGSPRYLGIGGISAFVLWAIGYEGLWPSSIRRHINSATLSVWYILHLIVLMEALIPVYVPRQAPRAERPVAIIDGKIILHRAVIEPARAKPGEILTIRLIWEALEPIHGNYALFIHALKPGEPIIVAQEDTYPLYGNYPTMHWMPRQPFQEIHHIRLPDHIDVPYVRLTAGMYRYETMERLPAFAPDGTRFHAGGPDAIPIGTVSLLRP